MASSTAPGSTSQEPAAENSVPKITLHWLEHSRAHRIMWLLEELNLPYELRTYSRQRMLAPKELKEIHPLGKSPVLTIARPDPSEKPIVIAESAVIIEYLLDHFGSNLVPKRYPEGAEGKAGGETEEWLRYRYYMHYAEGSLMPYMLMSLVLNLLKGPAVPFLVRPLTRAVAAQVENGVTKPNFDTQFAFLEQQLSNPPGGGKYIAGNFSGADIMMEYPLEAGKGRTGLVKEKYPKIFEYVDLLHEREAYKRAMKKVEETTGKPFALTPPMKL